MARTVSPLSTLIANTGLNANDNHSHLSVASAVAGLAVDAAQGPDGLDLAEQTTMAAALSAAGFDMVGRQAAELVDAEEGKLIATSTTTDVLTEILSAYPNLLANKEELRLFGVHIEAVFQSYAATRIDNGYTGGKDTNKPLITQLWNSLATMLKAIAKSMALDLTIGAKQGSADDKAPADWSLNWTSLDAAVWDIEANAKTNKAKKEKKAAEKKAEQTKENKEAVDQAVAAATQNMISIVDMAGGDMLSVLGQMLASPQCSPVVVAGMLSMVEREAFANGTLESVSVKVAEQTLSDRRAANEFAALWDAAHAENDKRIERAANVAAALLKRKANQDKKAIDAAVAGHPAPDANTTPDVVIKKAPRRRAAAKGRKTA